MTKRARRGNAVLSLILTIVSVVYMYPIFMILMNSLKLETAITTDGAFQLPNGATFAGIENYANAISTKGFLVSFGYTLFITLSSVMLILLCCSMLAWFIVRVRNIFTKSIYYLCIFSMVVPFQMVMFTLSSTADKLGLNTPWNICIIYLGFGAGLAVFMFCGFVKSIPLEIEEAAMIDGCNPIQIFFKVVFPILKPTMISPPFWNPCGSGTTTCCLLWCWISRSTAPSPWRSSTSAAAMAVWSWLP